MASFNRVILIGNLTRDPELKYLPSQTAVAEFGLAVNRKFKSSSGEEREDVLFIDIAAFGKLAEIVNKFCTKGKPVLIEGRLKYDTWEDKSGGKRNKISVIADNVQFLGSREESDGGGQGSSRRSSQPEEDTSDIPF